MPQQIIFGFSDLNFFSNVNYFINSNVTFIFIIQGPPFLRRTHNSNASNRFPTAACYNYEIIQPYQNSIKEFLKNYCHMLPHLLKKSYSEYRYVFLKDYSTPYLQYLKNFHRKRNGTNFFLRKMKRT